MMNLLSKKIFTFLVILGIVLGYGFILNNNSSSVNGATVTSTPTRPATPTPTRRITPTPPRPSPIINPTLPPGVTVTFYIEKVKDASEGGQGQFRLWSTQTGPTTSNGYFRVNYTISGTATHRVDYTGRYMSPLPGNILVKVGNGSPLPTGAEYDNLYIFTLADNLVEGTETVTLTLTGVNVGPGQGSATLNIADGPLVTPTPTRPGTPTATPTPSPTVTPTQSATPTPRVSSGYVVIYTIQSDWGNGAQINVTIINNTSTAVSGWTLAWTFPGAQTITNLWNGAFTQNGASVSVGNAAHNAMLSTNGGSVNFGFNLNYSGSNPRPSSFTLNGTSCVVQ